MMITLDLEFNLFVTYFQLQPQIQPQFLICLRQIFLVLLGFWQNFNKQLQTKTSF